MFPSPCGVLVDCDFWRTLASAEWFDVSIPLRGVSRLRLDKWRDSLQALEVSIPLRGVSRLRHDSQFRVYFSDVVSIPLRGVSRLRPQDLQRINLQQRVSIPLRGVSRLRRTHSPSPQAQTCWFPSPCGVLVDCDTKMLSLERGDRLFPSPCGVLVDCDGGFPGPLQHASSRDRMRGSQDSESSNRILVLNVMTVITQKPRYT